MSKIVIAALNTRHTHSSLSLACLQAYWDRIKGRSPIIRMDFDQNQGNDALISRLILAKPSFLAFSTYIWSVQNILAVSGAVKAALPETKIILGGPEVSFEGEPFMRQAPWIDAVIQGEGEKTFEEVLEKHLQGESFHQVAGVLSREGQHVRQNPPRELIKNLDELPSPFTAGLYGKGMGFTYYEASRGCPYRCAYCLSSVLGPLRNFSLERVLEDLNWFFQSEYTQVRFADRTFNFDVDRACKILEHILRNNHKKTRFHFELKPDLLDDRILDLLAQGDEDEFHLEIGVQSTDPLSLREVNRSPDVEKVAANICRLREKTRCHIHIDLLAGMPGETFPKFKKTLDEAFAWDTKTIQVGLVKALKGTSLRKRAENGEMCIAPFPPYAVVRSNWLSPEEIIKCQDMGRLVEGVYNPGKFARSLDFLINTLFEGVPSAFFESFADFWRGAGKPFYSFGAETIQQGLKDFLGKQTADTRIFSGFDALVLHEYRLSQKVPSGKAGPAPEFQKGRNASGWKLRPGLKIFWYEIDPLAFFDKQKNPFELIPAPVIYTYETDLSKSPKTGFLSLPLQERLFLSGIENYTSFEEFQGYYSRFDKNHSWSVDAFESMIEHFHQQGILINPKEKKKIFENSAL